jgi:hypothetical protein
VTGGPPARARGPPRSRSAPHRPQRTVTDESVRVTVRGAAAAAESATTAAARSKSHCGFCPHYEAATVTGPGPGPAGPGQWRPDPSGCRAAATVTGVTRAAAGGARRGASDWPGLSGSGFIMMPGTGSRTEPPTLRLCLPGRTGPPP